MNFTVFTHKGEVTYPRLMKIKYAHSHKALNRAQHWEGIQKLLATATEL